MEIGKEDIEKFYQIWREEFKEEVSEDTARARIGGELKALYYTPRATLWHGEEPRSLEK